MKEAHDLIGEAQSALVESEALLGKIDECRGRIRSAAGDMKGRYDAAIVKVQAVIRRKGIGAAPALERRLEKLLASRHACDTVAGGGDIHD
jgi:hypothetical protein